MRSILHFGIAFVFAWSLISPALADERVAPVPAQFRHWGSGWPAPAVCEWRRDRDFSFAIVQGFGRAVYGTSANFTAAMHSAFKYRSTRRRVAWASRPSARRHYAYYPRSPFAAFLDGFGRPFWFASY